MDLITADYFTITGYNSTQPLNTLNIDKIKFYPSINLYGYPDVENQTAWIEVKNETNNTWSTLGNALACFNLEGNCCVDFYPEANKQYRIRYSNLNILNPNPGCSIPYEIYRKNYTKQYLSGGGNRIKNIEYFEKNNTPPIKSKNYVYNFFDNTIKSSGSLVFPKPLFKYLDSFKFNVIYGDGGCYENRKAIYFLSNTSNNVFSPVRTNGGDIGYKNVKIFEDNLGKTEQTYTSPIDFPETGIRYELPFVTTSNIDYKRGLLKKEMIYNNNLIISENNYNIYEFDETNANTGISFLKPKLLCYTGSKFNRYDDYLINLNNPLTTCYECAIVSVWSGLGTQTALITMPRTFLCGLPLDINTPKILLFPSKTAIGWAKLKSKTTKNYFYPTLTSPANIVQTDETYDYNPINKKISEQTVTNSFGEVMKTKYFYLTTVDTPTSKNNISTLEKVETYRGSELLSTSKINYATNFPGNVSYLPQTITTSKGSNALENRVHYNRYDQFGHPLEVQQEHGMKTSYIYAYNSSQPVAKLENIGYANIPANLITAIQSATDSPNSNEAQVIDALNALRTSSDANLQKAIITTYTYKPLIGVSTITDPKGDKITYIYDAFNRLKEVRDKDNNILSENQYNYRP
jgi:YD repeat-containing protein